MKSAIHIVLESIADTFTPSLDEVTAARVESEYLNFFKSQFKPAAAGADSNSTINSLYNSAQTLEEVRNGDGDANTATTKATTGNTTAAEARRAFYAFKASDIPNCGALMEEYILKALPADKIPLFKIVIQLLGTSVGTLILTGYRHAFPTLSQQDREGALKALQSAYFQDLQIVYRAFQSIALLHTYGTAASSLVSWKTLNYSLDGVDELQEQSAPLFRPPLLDPTSDPVNFLECDIVIVGSGCGGGLMASQLAQAGYNVILCEKAGYTHNTDYVFTEREAMLRMYESAGGYQSEDGSITVLAGSAWGGGSAVNWCASFKPPLAVREEWAKKNGLTHLLSREFEEGMDTIWKVLGVDDSGVVHNVPNQILLDGCAKIGLKAETICQNTSGRDHQCGLCTMGCPSGVKNSSHLTWMKTAAQSGNCRFISDIYIDKIIHGSGTARGVEGLKNGKKVIIKAKKAVVVSGGSISTPALLLRSHIPRLNTHVGKHLRLHPVSVVAGVFPDRIIAPQAGSIMTAVSTHVDEKGYGYKIETPTSLPALFAVSQHWESGSKHKSRMLKWQHTSSLLVLTRDYDSEGRIYIDGAGKPRLEWALGRKDEKSMLHGIENSIKILLAEGATEVYTNQKNMDSFFRNPSKSLQETFDSTEFKDFIAKVHKEGLKPRQSILFSAHQMGSCRMHVDPKQGAVDSRGKLHGMNRLYVCDASVFPTASGVNPMMTTYSMAYSIAESLKQDLQRASARL